MAGHQCPICLKEFVSKKEEEEEKVATAVKLPDCQHSFHDKCLKMWLEHTSSCPLCRQELPTDDEVYEELKRQKKREKDQKL